MAWMISRLFLRKKQVTAATNSGLWMNLKRGVRAIVYLFNLHSKPCLISTPVAASHAQMCAVQLRSTQLQMQSSYRPHSSRCSPATVHTAPDALWGLQHTVQYHTRATGSGQVHYAMHAALVLLAASCVAVFICAENQWSFSMDFSMISTGTVFPLTFTLSQAYTRRERATSLIANLKASAMALYWMHRDWDQSNGYPASLGNDDLPSAVAAKTVIMELLLSTHRYLVSAIPFESMAEARLTANKHEFLALFEHDLHLSEKTRLFRSTVRSLLQLDEGQRHLRDCYKWLSKLSVMNEKLTLAAGYTRGGEGGFSRTNQYLRYIASNIEELRSIKEYRTPTMMRHACGVLLHIFAIALAPYYVHYCAGDDDVCPAAFASASAYVMIVMLLFHVQQDLENCFSETGLDDAFFLLHEEMDALTGTHILRSARSSMSDLTHVMHGQSPVRFASFELPNTALGQDKQPLRPIPETGKGQTDAEDGAPSTTLQRPSDNNFIPAGLGGWGRNSLYVVSRPSPSSVWAAVGSTLGAAGPTGGSPGTSRPNTPKPPSLGGIEPRGASPTPSISPLHGHHSQHHVAGSLESAPSYNGRSVLQGTANNSRVPDKHDAGSHVLQASPLVIGSVPTEGVAVRDALPESQLHGVAQGTAAAGNYSHDTPFASDSYQATAAGAGDVGSKVPEITIR